MGGVPILRCSECPRYPAAAATARRNRGLPQRSPLSATCSDRCERAREERFHREAQERGYRLAPGDWYCLECGCTAEEAVARRARDGLPLIAGVMAVCTPECGEARKGRRTAAESRESRWTAQPAPAAGRRDQDGEFS
jgi:hypothetical protein